MMKIWLRPEFGQGRGGRRARAALLVMALGTVVGCSEDQTYPGVMGADVGVPMPMVSDADFRDPTLDGGGDGTGDATAGDGGDGGDGGGDGADGGELRIELTIVSPTAGGVVPALMKFTPEVDVSVLSPSSKAEDTLKDVNAEVLERTTRRVVTRAKLNQAGFRTLPETSVLVYNFADTPIDLAMAASGNYDLVVTATTNGGFEASATQPFQIDAGPLVQVVSPIKDKPYKGSAPIDVTIRDEYFGPVSDVQMKIGQTALTFSGPGGPSGDQYTATLDFASFMPALEGEQILTVRAKNKNGTESVVVRKFISDSKGPVFANAKPKDGDLVGNVITIAVDLTDPAGVLASSVVAVFANGPGTEYTIPLRAPVDGDMMTTYSAVFDTRLLPFGENALFPTLSFRASDSLGNESLLTNVVWLDNRPPLADLDPPDMRVWGKSDSGKLSCSWPFDPVGNDATDDGEIVPQIATIRARIEDQGNEPLSGSPKYIPIAAVDSAQLLVLDDVTQPLLVNTNPVVPPSTKGDAICDAVNPNLVPTTRPMTSRDALVITLTPMAPAGAADMTNKDGQIKIGDERVSGGDDDGCSGGDNAKPPEPICEATGTSVKGRFLYSDSAGWQPRGFAMSLVLGYGGGGSSRMSSIWTIPKYEGGSINPLCGGTQLDTLANFVNDGWACVAVLSSDKLGNKQVSRPLRVCVDKNGDGMECPHRPLSRVLYGTPITVETVADHGLVTGDDVRIMGVPMLGRPNGSWKVAVTSARSFTLTNSTASYGTGTAWTRPTPQAGGDPFIPGHVVKVSEMPDCTGTVTAMTPNVVVDATRSCGVWRSYRAGEMRSY